LLVKKKDMVGPEPTSSLGVLYPVELHIFGFSFFLFFFFFGGDWGLGKHESNGVVFNWGMECSAGLGNSRDAPLVSRGGRRTAGHTDGFCNRQQSGDGRARLLVVSWYATGLAGVGLASCRADNERNGCQGGDGRTRLLVVSWFSTGLAGVGLASHRFFHYRLGWRCQGRDGRTGLLVVSWFATGLAGIGLAGCRLFHDRLGWRSDGRAGLLVVA